MFTFLKALFAACIAALVIGCTTTETPSSSLDNYVPYWVEQQG